MARFGDFQGPIFHWTMRKCRYLFEGRKSVNFVLGCCSLARCIKFVNQETWATAIRYFFYSPSNTGDFFLKVCISLVGYGGCAAMSQWLHGINFSPLPPTLRNCKWRWKLSIYRFFRQHHYWPIPERGLDWAIFPETIFVRNTRGQWKTYDLFMPYRFIPRNIAVLSKFDQGKMFHDLTKNKAKWNLNIVWHSQHFIMDLRTCMSLVVSKL